MLLLNPFAENQLPGGRGVGEPAHIQKKRVIFVNEKRRLGYNTLLEKKNVVWICTRNRGFLGGAILWGTLYDVVVVLLNSHHQFHATDDSVQSLRLEWSDTPSKRH